MKLLFNYQVFAWKRQGGISRVSFGLIENRIKDPQFEISISVKYSDNEKLKNINGLNVSIENQLEPFDDFLFGINFKGKGRIFNLYQKLFGKVKCSEEYNKEKTIQELKSQDFDVFIPSYYDDYFLEYLNGKPYVLIVHDMIQENTKSGQTVMIVGVGNTLGVSQ